MAGVELPVNPSLDSENRLRVLLPLFPNNPSCALPVALPALDGNWDLDMEARTGKAESFARLGVADAFAATTTINQVTTVWDALVGKKAIADASSPNPLIFETFWGAGLRVALTFTSVDVSTTLNVAAVAASSELRSMDVQYEIKSMGLGAEEMATLLETIPPLGRFDLDAYTLLMNARDRIIAALLKRLQDPVEARKVLKPVIIKLAQTPFDDELREGSEYRFVMQSIAAGLTQQQALDRLKASGWKARAEKVKEIYPQFAAQGSPTPAERSAAQKWLSTAS